MFKKLHLSRGFTLIEVLIVISIISILSGFLLSNFVGARQRARDGQRKTNLRQIAAALEIYRSDYGKYVDSTGSVGNASSIPSANFSKYMNIIPKDPNRTAASGCNSSSGIDYAYAYDASLSKYFLFALIENTNDQDVLNDKPDPVGAGVVLSSQGACTPSAANCKTFTFVSPVTCNGIPYNFWISNP